MNRITKPPSLAKGLDGLEYEYNHDDFGFSKVWPYLPPRVLDVMRYHSLREIPYSVYVNTTHSVDKCKAVARDLQDDPYRVDVTVEQARAFKASGAGAQWPLNWRRQRYVHVYGVSTVHTAAGCRRWYRPASRVLCGSPGERESAPRPASRRPARLRRVDEPRTT